MPQGSGQNQGFPSFMPGFSVPPPPLPQGFSGFETSFHLGVNQHFPPLGQQQNQPQQGGREYNEGSHRIQPVNQYGHVIQQQGLSGKRYLEFSDTDFSKNEFDMNKPDFDGYDRNRDKGKGFNQDDSRFENRDIVTDSRKRDRGEDDRRRRSSAEERHQDEDKYQPVKERNRDNHRERDYDKGRERDKERERDKYRDSKFKDDDRKKDKDKDRDREKGFKGTDRDRRKQLSDSDDDKATKRKR
jgi:hypothetical protein